MYKYFSIQGHRGARGLFPENTITAFIEAVKMGVDAIELDVVISKDNQVVVSHEPWMSDDYCSRPDGKPIEPNSYQDYNLYKMTYREIRQYDCGSRGNINFPLQKAIPEYKPLLSEVVEKVDAFCMQNGLSLVMFNVEIKSELTDDGIFQPEPKTFVDLVFNELRELNILNRCMLQSFDVRILQEIKKIDKKVIMALLVENNDGLDLNLNRLGFKPDIYNPEFIHIDTTLIEHLKEKGIKLLTWTVNELSDMKRLIDIGVEGIITDYPDRALALRNNKS